MRSLPAPVAAALLATLATAGCGKPTGRGEAGSGSASAAGSAVPAAAAPTLRLPDTAKPVRYRASLEIDPAATAFRGHVEIDVEVARATDVIWINGQDLSIDKAVLRRDGRDAPLVVEVLPRNFIALRGATPAGAATLVLHYAGKQDTTLSAGMRKHPDAGHDYVTTQFEPIGARRVFPSFDEPAFKVPWQLDLTVPGDDVALTNTAIASEEKLPDGRRRVRFQPTRPLPSYLIAIAVGPFDFVDAGKTRTGVPTRIVVPRGRGGDAGYAAREVGKVLNALEDYVGSPYPYDKLDHIVVPASLGGAMEHPGLITYGVRWLLIPDGESMAVRHGHVRIVAHELAHQWFGNLVTTAWWDDLWLNEAFASWLPSKITATVHPEMDTAVDPLQQRSAALAADTMTTARRVRQPITADADMGAAFDSITYQKGASVIRMFEQWIGPEVLQRAVRRYLAAHADTSVTAAAFLAALDAETGKATGAAMATFLDQAGVPQIDMTLRCDAGKPAVLALSQARFVPVSAGAPEGDARWQVPVCVRLPGDPQSRCTLLAERTGEIALGDRCPAWIVPNVGGHGYYLSRLPEPLQAKLFGAGWKQLSRAERLALVGDLGMMIDAGRAELGVLLELLVRLARADDPYLVDLAVTRLLSLARLVDDPQRPAFARLVRDALAAHGKRLGWTPRHGDSVTDARLRGKVMQLLAEEGDDAAARDAARALATAWIEDPTRVPESLWSAVLGAALRADAATVFPALVERVAKEPSRVIQRTIYVALAQVRDPDLQARAFALALQGEPMTAERIAVLGATPDTFALQSARFDFIRAKKDELFQRLPRDYRGVLLATTCDAARRDEVAAYLRTLTTIPEIGELRVTQAIEAMDLCIARRTAQAPALAAFLAGRR